MLRMKKLKKLSIAGLLKKLKKRRNDEAGERSRVMAQAGQTDQSDATGADVQPSTGTIGDQSDATGATTGEIEEIVESSTGEQPSDATGTTLRTFTYAELRDATRGFSFRRRSSEKSNSGRVFRGTLDNAQVSVKRLNRGPETELEVNDLSRLNHPNIVKMIGTCVEGPKQFIVYDYLGGTLHDRILGRKIGQKALDWATRMKIAAAIANGLRYLHHEVSPPVIHGNLKMYNILLGNGFDPKISDFCHPKEFFMAYQPLFYTAGMEGEITVESDVSSFGALLVEIVTGKTARDRTRSSHTSKILEHWLRPRLEKENKIKKLKDRKLKGQVDQDTLQKVMNLALRCVNLISSRRPDMRSVARAMNHFISEPNAAAWPWPWEFSKKEDDDYSQDCPQIFFYREISDATKEFSLQNFIGSGLYGKSYSGLLHERPVMIIVQPKRTVINEDMQLFPNTDLLRLRHPNVANLIGYCFEEKKHYLVYEFMPRGSLIDALACKNTEPLIWATRMKIAAGVAKVLNHLHGELGVVCKNFDSDIIYLDQEWNPKICALEFAPYTRILNTYAAPETNYRNCTYKSDMYSFGFLLVEIIAGKKVMRDKLESVQADPMLKGKFPEEMFVKAIRLASQCLDENPALRPGMIDVMKLMNELSPDPDLRALPVKPSLKRGESSQPARSLINNAGAQLSSTLAADVISRVEEALRPTIQRLEEALLPTIQRLEEALLPTIQRLEEACNHAVGARLSGTIVTQARAIGNKYTLFTFSQLESAEAIFIGRGKSGNVVKKTLREQTVAIKWLNTTERRNNYDHEVRVLSHLSHPNIINLIGCCAHEEQRMIVYEFMPLGNLYDRLHDRKSGQLPLDWDTRMKIASGVAEGLSYLHNSADPQVIYTDLQSSKILLGDGFHPKISGFINAESAPFDDHSTITTITHYCAPECSFGGRLTCKLDVFSFGVILLELVMGTRMPVVRSKTTPCNVNLDEVLDENDMHNLADPEMKDEFPEDTLKRIITMVAVCAQFNADSRPDMEVVVRAMNYLTSKASEWPAEFNDVDKSSLGFYGFKSPSH